jgi:hypothetical protein
MLTATAQSNGCRYRGEKTMSESVRKARYFYVSVPNRSGEASHILKALRDANVNLLGFSGFPSGRKSQLDFFPEDPSSFSKVIKTLGITVSQPKTGFLLQGDDRAGALAEVMDKLAQAEVNVVSAQVVAAPNSGYAAMIWVKPKDLRKASKALGAA